MQATRETPATKLARQWCWQQHWQRKIRNANNRTPTTSDTPTTAGPEIPATGTHKDLWTLFFLLSDSDSPSHQYIHRVSDSSSHRYRSCWLVDTGELVTPRLTDAGSRFSCRVYPSLPLAVWTCRVYPFPSLLYRRGCIHLHHQCGRARYIHLHRKQCGCAVDLCPTSAEQTCRLYPCLKVVLFGIKNYFF